MSESIIRAAADLSAAVYGKDIQKLRAALAAGADVRRSLDATRNTALHVACSHGWAEGMELLLGACADPYAENKYGYVPMHVAAQSGERRPVEILLEHGCDVHARSGIGYTPLMMAAEAPKGDAARLLLAYGANPMALCNGLTPVEAAVRCDRVDSILAFMEVGGAAAEVLQDDSFWARMKTHLVDPLGADAQIARLRRAVASHVAAASIESAMRGDETPAPSRSAGISPL